MDKAPNGKDKVIVRLVGEDENAFSILGRAREAMRKAKWTSEEIDEYTKKAQSGNYDNLLCVTMDYVEEPEDDSEDEYCGECGEEKTYCTCEENDEDDEE